MGKMLINNMTKFLLSTWDLTLKRPYPCFSPKCWARWPWVNFVSSPMFSTSRVSVMEAPSLPPRLRLWGWTKPRLHHQQAVLYNDSLLCTNVRYTNKRMQNSHFADGETAEELGNWAEGKYCLAVGFVQATNKLGQDLREKDRKDPCFILIIQGPHFFKRSMLMFN